MVEIGLRAGFSLAILLANRENGMSCCLVNEIAIRLGGIWPPSFVG